YYPYVDSSVHRWMSSRLQELPPPPRPRPHEELALVQAVLPVRPELDRRWDEAEARPRRGPRDRPPAVAAAKRRPARDEAAAAGALQEDEADRGRAATSGGGERHRLGERDAGALGVPKPAAETRERVGQGTTCRARRPASLSAPPGSARAAGRSGSPAGASPPGSIAPRRPPRAARRSCRRGA